MTTKNIKKVPKCPNEDLYTGDWTELKLLHKRISINSHEYLEIVGQAVAGVRSCIIIPNLGVVFDIGFCPELAINQRVVLVSHGHADHIGSLHLHSFQRQLRCSESGTYLMPLDNIESFKKAYESYKVLNHHTGYPQAKPSVIVPVNEADLVTGNVLLRLPKLKLNGEWVVRAYKTVHGVSSQGYLISRITKKLKQQYTNLCSDEIRKLVKSGTKVNEKKEKSIVGYSGDTTIDGIFNNPEFFETQVLIMECTYLITDNNKSSNDTPTEARKKGHIHEADIHKFSEMFQNECIILCHFSPRYNRLQILASVDRLQKVFGTRLVVKALI